MTSIVLKAVRQVDDNEEETIRGGGRSPLLLPREIVGIVPLSMMCFLPWHPYRNRLILARSMISLPRPLRTALSMNRLKPLICSRVIVGGMASS